MTLEQSILESLQASLQEKSRSLKPHFKNGFLQRDKTAFQFEFPEEPAFYLQVAAESYHFEAGKHEQPTLTLHVSDHETLWGLLEGSIDGMKAFMEGSYRADGNIVLSQLLLYLFKSTDPSIVYEVQY